MKKSTPHNWIRVCNYEGVKQVTIADENEIGVGVVGVYPCQNKDLSLTNNQIYRNAQGMLEFC